MSNNSFVFYDSWIDALCTVPQNDRLRYYEYLCLCCANRIDIAEVPYPYCTFIIPLLAFVKVSKQRYEKSIENGSKGGAREKWIDRDVLLLYLKDHTQKEAAEHFNCSERKIRYVLQAAKPAKAAKTVFAGFEETSGKNGRQKPNADSFNESYESADITEQTENGKRQREAAKTESGKKRQNGKNLTVNDNVTVSDNVNVTNNNINNKKVAADGSGLKAIARSLLRDGEELVIDEFCKPPWIGRDGKGYAYYSTATGETRVMCFDLPKDEPEDDPDE